MAMGMDYLLLLGVCCFFFCVYPCLSSPALSPCFWTVPPNILADARSCHQAEGGVCLLHLYRNATAELSVRPLVPQCCKPYGKERKSSLWTPEFMYIHCDKPVTSSVFLLRWWEELQKMAIMSLGEAYLVNQSINQIIYKALLKHSF